MSGMLCLKTALRLIKFKLEGKLSNKSHIVQNQQFEIANQNASQRNIVLKFPELLIKLPNTSHLSLVKTFPAAQIYKLPIFTSIGDR